MNLDHSTESVAPCCQRLMDGPVVCTVPLHQECPTCERRWLWDQGTWTALDVVSILREARSVLEDVDDWGHPYSHNVFVKRVDTILGRINAALIDGPGGDG